MRSLDDAGEVATPKPSHRKVERPFVIECRLRPSSKCTATKAGYDGRSIFWSKQSAWHKWKAYAKRETALRVIEIQNRKLEVYEYRLRPEEK